MEEQSSVNPICKGFLTQSHTRVMDYNEESILFLEWSTIYLRYEVHRSLVFYAYRAQVRIKESRGQPFVFLYGITLPKASMEELLR